MRLIGLERLCSGVTLDSRLSYPDIRERVLQDLHHFLIALADMVEDAEEALRWIQVVVFQSFAILLVYHLEASEKLPDAIQREVSSLPQVGRNRRPPKALPRGT